MFSGFGAFFFTFFAKWQNKKSSRCTWSCAQQHHFKSLCTCERKWGSSVLVSTVGSRHKTRFDSKFNEILKAIAGINVIWWLNQQQCSSLLQQQDKDSRNTLQNAVHSRGGCAGPKIDMLWGKVCWGLNVSSLSVSELKQMLFSQHEGRAGQSGEALAHVGNVQPLRNLLALVWLFHTGCFYFQFLQSSYFFVLTWFYSVAHLCFNMKLFLKKQKSQLCF